MTRSAATSIGLSNNLRGMLWKTAGTFSFSLQQVLVRHISFGLHPFEIAFFRNLFGLLFIVPWFLHDGFELLRTKFIWLHVLRANLELMGMLAFFYALSMTPLAQIAALGFATPIFTTILAVVFLKETVGLRRWAAILFGFAGTLVTLRLGTGPLSTGALVMLLSTVFLAFALLLVKVLSRTDSSVTIISYSNILMLPMSLVAALLFWQWLDWQELMWLVILGLVSTAASFLDTQGLRLAETHVVMPLEFFKLIWAALLGYVLFSEGLDAYTWVGGTMIFASAGYIAYRAAKA
jgi:drug/metabolite transporter (DMT)-like permease